MLLKVHHYYIEIRNYLISSDFQLFPWLTVPAPSSSTITSLSRAQWRDWPTPSLAASRKPRVAGQSADQIVNRSPGTNALKFPFQNVHSKKYSFQLRNSSTERNVYSQIPRRIPDHPMRRQYLETWKWTSLSLIMNWTMLNPVSPLYYVLCVKTVNKTWILRPPLPVSNAVAPTSNIIYTKLIRRSIWLHATVTHLIQHSWAWRSIHLQYINTELNLVLV